MRASPKALSGVNPAPTGGRSGRRVGLSPRVLVGLYGAAIAAPVVLAWTQGLAPRPWQDLLSSMLAMAGFTMMMVAFVLSGRFQTVSGRIGIDQTMRLHQLSARLLAVPVLIHPFLYATPIGPARPWDTSGSLTLGLDGPSALTGIAAWLLLAALVITAIRRDQLPFRYETWRLTHGLGAWLIALLTLHHVLTAGRYSADPILAGWWIAMVTIASLTLLHTYLVIPLKKRRHGYHVTAVAPIAERTWEVFIRPDRGPALDFEAGQFVWLNLGSGPFGLEEHPFSISSAPAERPDIGFTIKAVGDFTGSLGSLAVGAPAYMDGPYGTLTYRHRAAAGLAFVAGGVGIAPILSMLRQLRAEQDRRPIILVYGNRLESQIVHREELDRLSERLNITVHHVLGEPTPDWKGLAGQLDRAVLAQCLGDRPPADWLYFGCGPPAMIDAMTDALRALRVPAAGIIVERFYYA